MERQKEIKTKMEMLKAIKEAKLVFVSPTFGTSEVYIQVTKKSAENFIHECLNNSDTPESHEMFGSNFGLLSNGALYIG